MSRRMITMGTWEDKPIEWIVLKEDECKSLVISRYAIMSLYLSWNGRANTWIDCSLREYLNKEFWENAFTEKEKKRIVNSFLKEPDETKDNVFLLSEAEIKELLPTNDDRKLGNGIGCNGHNCDTCYKYSNMHGTCYYLRTVYDNNSMKAILSNGSFTDDYFDDCSIRPSMWILN